MQIIIDTKTDSHDDLRIAAAFLLHIVGDLGREETPDPKEAAPSIATAPAIASSVAPVAVNVPPPPAIVPAATALSPPPPPPVPTGTNGDEGEDTEGGTSNVLPFPTPVPPPPPVTTPPVVGTAGVPNASVTLASTSGPSGVDSAGMPYDGRIHQKTGNKKKDGTWKLIKGIDDAVVAAVTAELAARKGAVAPVSLPQGSNTVPMPPPPAVTAPNSVPTPPVTAPVPVPPVTPVGAVGASGPSFRELIDKITAATKANQITPQKVAEVCQMHGAPNLMQLNAMSYLIADVSSSIDAVIAGLG